MSGKLTILVGDATKPENLGKVPIIIPHIVNNLEGGAWGNGFVLAINKAFGLAPKKAYHAWANGESFVFEKDIKITNEFALGEVQFVYLPEKWLAIANMVGQHQVAGMDKTGRPPIRYGSLVKAMNHVKHRALNDKYDIVSPRFGSGLAMGSQQVIEEMIQEIWVDSGINVSIYDFPEASNTVKVIDEDLGW